LRGQTSRIIRFGGGQTSRIIRFRGGQTSRIGGSNKIRIGGSNLSEYPIEDSNIENKSFYHKLLISQLSMDEKIMINYYSKNEYGLLRMQLKKYGYFKSISWPIHSNQIFHKFVDR